MKISTVIFDFGNVLISYDPKYMVSKYVVDESDIKLLSEVVFDRLYWDKLDAGTITDEETLSKCRSRLPERLWDIASTIYYNWIYNIPEIEGMRELVEYIKSRYGVRMLVLSNISKYFSEHSNEIPILKLFDGCVFSAPIGMVKPSREIFEYICSTYSVNSNKCVFIDDNKSNILGAVDYGMSGYVFDGNVAKLKEYLDKLLVD